MNSNNQLRVTLGKPLPDVNAHQCLYVQQGADEQALTISFKRTIRVPDDDATYQLPPNLGKFPLYKASNYKKTLPEGMMLKGGCFVPVHEREALWIRFKSTRPFAIKVHLGNINAISGEPIIESFATLLRRHRLMGEKKSIQDYVVIDPAEKGQFWLDGIAKHNGKVMQFVAVSAGTGYSVEAQIARVEAVGGIQISITPIKAGPVVTLNVKRLGQTTLAMRVHLNATVYELMTKILDLTGIPVEQQGILLNNRRLEPMHLLSHYDIQANATLSLVLNLQGGGIINIYNCEPGEMGVAAGGLIKQSILRDPHASSAWDGFNTVMFNIQLLNANLFTRVTDKTPPPSPVTAETYAEAGLPFFALPEEPSSDIQGTFSDIKSISQLDRDKGKDNLEKELKFPIIQLDRTGRRAPFSAVEEMEEQIRKFSISRF